MKVRLTAQIHRAAGYLALASLVWAIGSASMLYESQLHPSDMQSNNISTEESDSTFENQYDSGFPNDWLQPESFCSPFHLMEAHFSQYASFPLSLMKLKRVHACEELDEKRNVVELERHPDLQPRWLEEATVVGECPWELVRREFTSVTVPPSIIEVSCLCDGHRCSRLGDFKCVPVTRTVKIWTIEHHSFGLFRSLIMRVTAACVCAQRRSLDGGNAQPGLDY